ncbi:hypothetical protein BJN34_01560 [Cupriavidus necator]|uniref:Transposase n=1 Tax=Cupriavidus necator TaxID=106590 RepID=A0A1U9UJG8_CUPNE|nr:hypothetical protein [Cupriavidus necator]AQV92577.1 hypothetical protein BJN34_01560 [Cupriavidus necator]
MMETADVGLLLRGGMLGGKRKLHRLVGLFPEYNEAFVSELQTGKKPKSKKPKPVALDMLLEQLYREVEVVDECVRYPWMDWPDDRLAKEVPSALTSRDVAIKGLAGLYDKTVLQETDLLVFTRSALLEKVRVTAIRECAERSGLKIRQVYKLVNRILTFGPVVNALLNHKKLSGGPGKKRRGGKRTGRPNAYAKRSSRHPFAGQVMSKYHVGKFRSALTEYFVGQDLSLSATYRQMRLNLYVQRMPDGKGGFVVHAVRPGKIPSFEQFYDYYCECRARGEFVNDKAGDAEYEENRKAYVQSARDISDGPLDIFDVDGTGGKIELVATYHPDRLIGRPMVILAVDRDSDAIVGAYVTTFGESTEAYKKCMYIAFTSKETLLKKLGLPLCYWIEFGQCNAMFVDQGPGKSREIELAFVVRLNRGRFIAPAGAPRAKAIVEGINDKLHDWMTHVEGAYDRTNDGERKAERRASAKKRARRTRRDYWRKLIEFIYLHNTTTDVSHLLTPEMRRDRVKGFPRDIFVWGKEQRRGAERQERSRSELAKLLLECLEKKVQEDGVHLNNRTFASSELLRVRDDHMSRHAHWAKMPALAIPVYLNPHDPDVIYWEPEPGELRELPATNQSRKRTVDMSYDDWLDCMEADKENAIDARNKLNARTYLSKAQVDILLTIAKNRTAAQVRAEEIRTNRALEQMLENAEAEAEQKQALFGDEVVKELAASTSYSTTNVDAPAAGVAELSDSDAKNVAGKKPDKEPTKDGFEEVYAEIFGE